jgi:hypothetical protein
MPRLLAPVAAVAVCVLVGIGAVLTDMTARADFGPSGGLRHLSAALLLYGAASVAAGCVAALAASGFTWASLRGRRRAGIIGLSIASAALAGAAIAPTAYFTFATERLQGSAVAVWAPRLVILVSALAASGAFLFVLWGIVAAARGRHRVACGVSAAFGLAALLAVRVDLTVYVSLYARLHAVLEAVGGLAAVAALAPITTLLAVRTPT